MTAEELLKNIDWSELRNQKRTLSAIINDGYLPDEEPKNDLIGLLHLIDSLQDYACDELNIDSIHIYDFDDEEQNDGDVKFENKTVEVEYLNNVDWTSEEKIIVKSIINRFGTGQHPYCDEKTFSYFTKKYLIEIIETLSELKEKDTGLNEEGLKVLKQIKNKLGIL